MLQRTGFSQQLSGQSAYRTSPTAPARNTRSRNTHEHAPEPAPKLAPICPEDPKALEKNGQSSSRVGGQHQEACPEASCPAACCFQQYGAERLCNCQVDPSNRLAFDAPLTLPCIAPRFLLVLNGEKDPRCPLEGVQKCIEAAKQAYEQEGQPEHLKIFIEKDVEHNMTATMWQKIESSLEVSLGLPATSKLYPELCGIPVHSVLCVDILKRLQPY